MVIRGASLVNRFYESDGWTAELVAELLADPDVKWVTTRYDNEGSRPASPHDMERSRPSYFAVYDNGFGREDGKLPPPFLLSKISEHEYDPFCLSPGKPWNCDLHFSSKNRVLDDVTEKRPGKDKK